MKKVFIVGTSFFHQFHSMYTKRGYTIVDSIDEADIVQFTGGADISPKFYNQHEHDTTYTSPARDKEEMSKIINIGEVSSGGFEGMEIECNDKVITLNFHAFKSTQSQP